MQLFVICCFFFFLDNFVWSIMLKLLFFFYLFAGNFCLSTSVISCAHLYLCGVGEYSVIHEELNQSSLSHVILHCINFLFQMKWMGVALYGIWQCCLLACFLVVVAQHWFKHLSTAANLCLSMPVQGLEFKHCWGKVAFVLPWCYTIIPSVIIGKICIFSGAG